MQALGVPSVQALALVGSPALMEDGLMRDERYTGEPELLHAGVLLRVSPSFVRFGSLQLAAKRQGPSGLARLARHVLEVLAEQARLPPLYRDPLLLYPRALSRRDHFKQAPLPLQTCTRAAAADQQDVLHECTGARGRRSLS